jgi:hypothetical protein
MVSTVNTVLDSRWAETVQQLALGIEPVDALRGVRVGQRLNITLEAPPPGLRAVRLTRHDSGLFALLHGNGDAADLVVRIFDAAFKPDSGVYDPDRSRRRFVPRRLAITVPAADQAEALALSRRARRPALFAGAAYDATAATGLRGRVQRGGVAVRWARIEARRAGSALTVGRAHGDDRGEFLLLLDAAAAPMSVLEVPFAIELHVWLPVPPAPLPTAAQQAADPLWDLPVETLSPTGALPDAVADGGFPLAAGWTEVAAPVVVNDLPYGVVHDGLVVLNV